METIYTTHHHDIHLDSITTVTPIWFWGDVHRDAVGCDVDRWKWFLQKSAKEEALFMGMGDYHDLASAREQKHLNRDALHETTMETIDELVERRNREFCTEIKHMKGKLLGLIDGNHNWRFPNGVTASEDLANRMGCPHLGWLTHYSIKFNLTGGKIQFVDIVACHGKAGGKRVGNSINQIEDLKSVFPIADIYVMGHNHDRGAWPVDILYRSKNDIKQKRQFLCRSGSFLKGYTEGTSNYVTGRLLRPADIGALRLNISFHRDLTDGDRIITDIEAVI